MRTAGAVLCEPCLAARIFDHPDHECRIWTAGWLAGRDGHFHIDERLDERPAACPCPCPCRDEQRTKGRR
ncbi:hypothetical protein [Streptomyces sp. NPDC005955]|uniref:hypothetical protein n=1 Tax=Streptomyces sp. NPDC005955 TaxID=3364738 RepID=UPI0036AFFF8F